MPTGQIARSNSYCFQCSTIVLLFLLSPQKAGPVPQARYTLPDHAGLAWPLIQSCLYRARDREKELGYETSPALPEALISH